MKHHILKYNSTAEAYQQNNMSTSLKKELPPGAVVAIIAGVLAIIIGAYFLIGRGGKPATPQDAGLGKPALPGGATQEDPGPNRPPSGQ